jgi:phage FluMu protein Com
MKYFVSYVANDTKNFSPCFGTIEITCPKIKTFNDITEIAKLIERRRKDRDGLEHTCVVLNYLLLEDEGNE